MNEKRFGEVVYPIEEFMLGTGERVVEEALKDIDCRKRARQCANYIDGQCVIKDIECYQKDAKYCNCRYMLHCVLPPEVAKRVKSGEVNQAAKNNPI